MQAVVGVAHDAEPEDGEHLQSAAADEQHRGDDLAPAHRLRSISRANVSDPISDMGANTTAKSMNG